MKQSEHTARTHEYAYFPTGHTLFIIPELVRGDK